MGVFVTRQPVFDSGKDVRGYELLFRAGFDSYYDTLDADKATIDLLAFVDFRELTDGKRGFVSFPRSLLLKEFSAHLSSEMVTVGIPDDVEPDEEVLAMCRKLKAAGCELAMDNFVPARRDSPLLELADIVKVDFTATGVVQRRAICEELIATGVKAMARKVATPQEFDQAVGWGYSYFHGSFFSKPVIQVDKEISASKLVQLRVLNEVNQSELPYDDLEDLIKQDVSLTYKLLRFMNSVWFGLRYEVRSIKHALVLLGPKAVRKWASLVVVGRAASDKPRELLLRSLSRARAGELLAPLIGMAAVAPELFLMGMFSVIDALMDMPMIDVLGRLPLNKSIKGALLAGEGPFGLVLDTIVAYEQGEWERFSSCAQTLGLDEGLVPDLLTTSLQWANHAVEAI